MAEADDEAVFDGFSEQRLPTERGEVFARVGGSGPPLLLLHGYPQSGLMWHSVAPLLTEQHTVVVADLPGYGGSFRPVPAADHAPHSKRALAGDLVQVMAELGHERFAVAGHDRGGRVAYRMALDHPGRVTAVAVLDIVPTAEVWARADDRFAIGYWHWGFLAQPAPLPEHLILADPDAYFDHHVRRLGIGTDPERYPAAVLAAYRAQVHDPGTVAAICEDYRAGASIDREIDQVSTSRGERIRCPVLTLWGSHGALPGFYGETGVVGIWRQWADDVTGRAVSAGHFLVEDAPEQTAADLLAFFDRWVRT